MSSADGRALKAVAGLGDVSPSVAACYALGFKAGASFGKPAGGMTVASLQNTAATSTLLIAGGIASAVAAEKSLLFAEVRAAQTMPTGVLRRTAFQLKLLTDSPTDCTILLAIYIYLPAGCCVDPKGRRGCRHFCQGILCARADRSGRKAHGLRWWSKSSRCACNAIVIT